MSRLLAIVPLGFALFFTGTSIEVWKDFFHPQFADMRLMDFVVAWIQTLGMIGCWVATIGLLAGALERENK